MSIIPLKRLLRWDRNEVRHVCSLSVMYNYTLVVVHRNIAACNSNIKTAVHLQNLNLSQFTNSKYVRTHYMFNLGIALVFRG